MVFHLEWEEAFGHPGRGEIGRRIFGGVIRLSPRRFGGVKRAVVGVKKMGLVLRFSLYIGG